MSRIDRWIEAEWQVTRMRVLNKLGEMIFVEGADRTLQQERHSGVHEQAHTALEARK